MLCECIHTLTIEGTNGARIPPTLQDMEQTPKPAFLKHKKNSRNQKMLNGQNHTTSHSIKRLAETLVSFRPGDVCADCGQFT